MRVLTESAMRSWLAAQWGLTLTGVALFIGALILLRRRDEQRALVLGMVACGVAMAAVACGWYVRTGLATDDGTSARADAPAVHPLLALPPQPPQRPQPSAAPTADGRDADGWNPKPALEAGRAPVPPAPTPHR